MYPNSNIKFWAVCISNDFLSSLSTISLHRYTTIHLSIQGAHCLILENAQILYGDGLRNEECMSKCTWKKQQHRTQTMDCAEECGCYPKGNRQALRSFHRWKRAYIQRPIPHVLLRENLSRSSVITDSLWQGQYVCNCYPYVLPLLSFISIFSWHILSIYYVSGSLLGNLTHVMVLKVPAILIALGGSSHFSAWSTLQHTLAIGFCSALPSYLVNMAEFDPGHSFWRKT